MKSEPDQPMAIPFYQQGVELDLVVPLPSGKAADALGKNAHITFKTSNWS